LIGAKCSHSRAARLPLYKPHWLGPAPLARCVHQGQGVFGQVRGDARVDELDLAGLALEGGIQASAQHVEVALVDQADGLVVAGKLGQEAVAVVQLVDQCAALGATWRTFH
jgi:hypothetical protein